MSIYTSKVGCIFVSLIILQPPYDLLMRYGINRFFSLMSNFQTKILQKVLNAIDSDDILTIALHVESNLSKEQIDKLQKMLKTELQQKNESSDNIHCIKQFLNFIE